MLSPLSARRLPDGTVGITRAGVPLQDSFVVLVVSAEEWDAFLAGIAAGEFDPTDDEES